MAISSAELLITKEDSSKLIRQAVTSFDFALDAVSADTTYWRDGSSGYMSRGDAALGMHSYYADEEDLRQDLTPATSISARRGGDVVTIDSRLGIQADFAGNVPSEAQAALIIYNAIHTLTEGRMPGIPYS